MAIDQSSGASALEYIQLTSARVPLEQAGDALVSQDASGRTPSVVLTQRQNRINNVLLLIGLIILVGRTVWAVWPGDPLLGGAAVPAYPISGVFALSRRFL